MKFFKKNKVSFSRRIVFTTVFLTLLPLILIGLCNTTYIYRQLNKVITENNNIQIESVKRVLETNIEIVKLLQYNLMGNKQIIEVLEQEEVTQFDLSKGREYLREEVVLNYGWTIGIIRSVYVFKDEQQYIHITKDSYNSAEFGQNISVFKKNFGQYGTIISTDELRNNIFHIGTPLMRQEKMVGYVVITVDIDQFSSVFMNMKTDAFTVYITNDKNIVFASTQKSRIGEKLPEAQENQIKEELNWGGRMFAVIEISSKNIIASVWYTVVINLLILITFTSAATFISNILSRNLVRGFKDLINIVKEFSKGNLDTRVPTYQDEEFDAIGHAFNSMAKSINELIYDTYQKELLIKEMQIQALQSQINPHFLFNTLTTISIIAKHGETELTHKMISTLSKLLRERILTGQNEFSTLKSELLITDYYIYIQKVRYGKRLNYVLNRSESTLEDWVMPKLLLQPLVENAFCHGIEKKLGGGTITVNVDCQEEYLTLEILDDGVGFMPTVTAENGNDHKHITLTNIRKRLNLYYANNYVFDIQSKVDVGTRVFIKIPKSQNNKRIGKNFR